MAWAGPKLTPSETCEQTPGPKLLPKRNRHSRPIPPTAQLWTGTCNRFLARAADMEVCTMALSIEIVTESLSFRREHVVPVFAKDARFNPSGWCSSSAKSPVSNYRLHPPGGEPAALVHGGQHVEQVSRSGAGRAGVGQRQRRGAATEQPGAASSRGWCAGRARSPGSAIPREWGRRS